MVVIIFISVVLTIIIYFWSKRKFNYWKKKNVKYPKPIPFFGNYKDYILLRKNNGDQVQDICRMFPDEPLIGAYYGTEPVAIIQGPELVKLVTTKDFYYFNAREVSEYTTKEKLTTNMFFTYGDRWRVLRQNLTPVFSSAKMKNMFHLIEKCTRVFEKLLDEETKINRVLEMRYMITRFTMDCISACAFGIDTHAMSNDSKSNPFLDISSVIFDISKVRGLKTVFRAIWPSVFYGLRMNLFPISIYNFFHTLLSDVFNKRKGTPSNRHDFVDLMMGLKNSDYITGDSIKNMKGESNKKTILKSDDDLVIAQCVLFFAAGFETSATTSSFTLYELAKQPELQKKVQAEVDEYIKSRGEVQYDCTTELPFLEQCIDETLRLYPVLPLMTREVYEDYQFPNGVKLERGMRVHIPVYAIQRDSKNFPDPEEYRPSRFSPEEKKNIRPYTYFPFGEGPRICIGMRFAKMQMMAGLVTVMKKYNVELADDMPHKLHYESTAMVIQCKGGIKLRLTPREGWEQRVFTQN